MEPTQIKIADLAVALVDEIRAAKSVKAWKAKASAHIKSKMLQIVDSEGNELDATLVVNQIAPSEDELKEMDEDEEMEDKANGDEDEEDEDGETVKSMVDTLVKRMESAEKRAERLTEARIKALDVKVGEFRNDDKKRFGFKHLSEQLQCIAKATQSGGHEVDERLHTKASLGLNETTDSEGGFMVAPEFSSEILKIIHESEPLSDKTTQIPISAPSIKVPGIDETSRATGSRRGGVRGYWLAEAGSVTASKPKFRQIELAPHKLGVLVYATDEMLEDGGPALGQIVSQSAADEISFLTGDAIINGSGAGQPLGILNSAAKVEVAKQAGQAASTVVAENIVKMWARLHTSARKNAVWYINQDIEPQLHLMNVSVGTGGQLVYMPPGGLSGQPFATLYGRPVVETEFNATLGTAGDIILADLSHYYTATRGALRSDMSMHVQFLTDELAFRFLFKVDGQSSWHSALTPFKGTATQSPFITLADRS